MRNGGFFETTAEYGALLLLEGTIWLADAAAGAYVLAQEFLVATAGGSPWIGMIVAVARGEISDVIPVKKWRENKLFTAFEGKIKLKKCKNFVFF